MGVPLEPNMHQVGYYVMDIAQGMFIYSVSHQIQDLEVRQASLLKMKRHAEEQIAEAEAKVRGHSTP